MRNLKRAVDILRLEHNLTASEMVERSGMSVPGFYNALRSSRCTVSSVNRIAGAFGLKGWELLKRAEELD